MTPQKIDKITIAVTHMDSMVAFYNAIFDAQLQPVPDSPFYTGQLFGFPLFFCPNSIAKVNAEQTRFQFDVVVDNGQQLIKQAVQSGGKIRNPRTETEQKIIWGLNDPDGNTFVIVENRE